MGMREKEGPIDVYAGAGAEWDAPDSVDELPDEERQSETVAQRLVSEAGQDLAYDMGLSPRKLPAPYGGWPSSTPAEELLP